MIEYGRFIYLDVQRTGSMHVIGLLEKVCEDPLVLRRRHGPISKRPFHLLRPRKLTFATVRNPWDWYVSLWSFGVGKKSAMRRWLKANLPPSEAKAFYDTADPFASFRRWLFAVHDPAFADRIMQEGYPQSRLSEVMGFYTFRFQRVTTSYPRIFLRRWMIGDVERIVAFHARHKAYDAILRTEKLSADLAAFAAEHRERCRFRADAPEIILAADRTRANASPRPSAGYRDYYDEASRELVARRDRFFIDQFGYRF